MQGFQNRTRRLHNPAHRFAHGRHRHGEGTTTKLRIYSGDSTFALNDLGETVYGRGCAADLPIAEDITIKIIICCASVAVILVTALLCMKNRKKQKPQPVKK